VNFSFLKPPPAVEVGSSLVLNLFPNLQLIVKLEDFERTKYGYAWIGSVQGMEHSRVILVVVNGVLSGSVRIPKSFFLIEYAGEGLHGVYEINECAVPGDPLNTPVPDDSPTPSAVTPLQVVSRDDASRIDVMVVYTPAARAGAGGTSQIRALIDQMILQTNDAFSNSQVNTRLRLVYTAEVNYTESGDLSLDLERLQTDGDGYLDDVHPLRDTYGADLVSLIVEQGDSAGIAYKMEDVAPWFADWAFSVVVREYAVSNYTFSHEIGHNMGADHDWYVSTSTDPYTYCHGYVAPDRTWRTIMAYWRECDDCALTYCDRIPHYSNPNVLYNGVPTGVPGNTDTSCVEGDCNHPECDADVARTFNNTAYTVANFRQTTIPLDTAALFRVERETGNVLADGSFYGASFESGSADVAEWVPVSEEVDPGDVLEIDPERPGYYRKARGPCSSLVAGVVSTEPGFVLGHGEDTEGKVLLALMGIVPVKVTDEGGPIQPGDLLVVSSTPGYAMRWDPDSGLCGFVGKALEPWEEGEGVILVLLMR